MTVTKNSITGVLKDFCILWGVNDGKPQFLAVQVSFRAQSKKLFSLEFRWSLKSGLLALAQFLKNGW